MQELDTDDMPETVPRGRIILTEEATAPSRIDMGFAELVAKTLNESEYIEVEHIVDDVAFGATMTIEEVYPDNGGEE